MDKETPSMTEETNFSPWSHKQFSPLAYLKMEAEYNFFETSVTTAKNTVSHAKTSLYNTEKLTLPC